MALPTSSFEPYLRSLDIMIDVNDLNTPSIRAIDFIYYSIASLTRKSLVRFYIISAGFYAINSTIPASLVRFFCILDQKAPHLYQTKILHC